MKNTNKTGSNGSAKRPKRIAIYVIFDKDGILDGYRKYYLEKLREVTDCIVGVVNGTLTPESRAELAELTDDFFVRENTGLLAYGWIEGIKHIGWDKLYEYDELLMLNDSFFGPFYPLSEMMDAAEKSDADFYGATKNFDEKAITTSEGRPFKHGHLRGSICYFYIIKSRLLHSPEFKSYWSSQPNIQTDFDTFFFSEFDFYDYVVDAGFRVEAYQSDKLKGYFYDNLTHNMVKLIEDDRVPFARMRAFSSDMKFQSLLVNYGKDPRETLEFIDKNTEYDVGLIWDYLLRTKNLTNIWNQLQLEYVVPKDSVEKPFQYEKPVAVILHIYYEDQVAKLADYCLNFTDTTDFYITTTSKETYKTIEKEFGARGIKHECQIRRNVGVAMSTLWVTYADVVTSGKYEYICYFHDKKSPYTEYSVHGEQFGLRCYENLFGTKEVVKNIINLFEDNPRMGVLGAPMVYHANYFASSQRCWRNNYQNTVDLAAKLDMHVNMDINVAPVAPYGDMFWFRSAALKKVIGQGMTYDDFDVPYAPDCTIMHAIERIYGFAAQDSGYYYADVVNSDDARSDLVNYQYMLYKICELMIAKGNEPYNFEYLKSYIQQLQVPTPFDTIGEKLRRIIPKPIWNFCRRVYIFFGGR